MARDPFEELSEAAENNPDDPWVWLRLAEAFVENGGVPIAKHVLVRACGCAGDDPDVWTQIGAMCERCGDDAGALAAYRNAAERRQGLDHHIGRVLLRLGKPKEAEKWLRAALGRAPGSIDLAFELARALVDQARFADAREILSRGAAEKASDVSQLSLLATIGRHLCDTNAELEALMQIRKLRPDDPQAVLDLAQALVDAGEVEAAEYELARLDAEAQIHLRAGRLLMRAERPLAAAHHLSRVALARPDSAESHRELARAFEAAGRPKDAIASYQKAARIAEDPATLLGLGRSLAAEGRFREASTVLVRAAALAPEDDSIREMLKHVLTGQEPAPRMNSLDGDLGLFSVPELLEFLAVQHATGVLEVSSPRGDASVRLLDGRILQAMWKGGESLADVLVRLGLLEPGVLADVDADNVLVIRRIADQKLMPIEVMRKVLATQIIDGLVRIIALRDGRASFAKTPRPSVAIDPDILVDSRFALLEATRRLDELNGRTHS